MVPKVYSIDEDKVNHVVKVFEQLRHTKGRWKGSPFYLMDWEYKIVHDVFGTVDENGIRKYRTVYIEIPKKNGKSPFASGLAAYLLTADGEPSPEVYSCAVDKEQASIVYKYVAGMTRQCSALKRRLKYVDSQKYIRNMSNDGEFRSLSADVPSKHGLTPSAIIFDELHAQKGREFHDVMTSGVFAAREQPLLIYITTAGLDIDRTSICWKVRQRAMRVLKGESVEEDFYAAIYSLGEDKDWEDPDYWKKEKNWYKANPSLGETIRIEDMRADFNKTIDSMVDEELFKQLRLNIWVNQRSVTWLPMKTWDRNALTIDYENLKGKECYCGLDLSTTTDLTAFVMMFPEAGEDGRHIVIPKFWIPEDDILEREKRDGVPYREWEKLGLISFTQGNVVDQDCIEAEIIKLSKEYNIMEIGYDDWNSVMLVTHLESEGLVMIKVSQSKKNLSVVNKELEKLILKERLQHGGHPVLRWNFGNVKAKTDENENLELKKASRNARIDGIDALVSTIHRLMANQEAPRRYYGGVSAIEI